MSFPFVSRSAHAALETKMGELNQEYQNFRRRNASVREDAYRQGGSDAIAALLPVYDNLKLALEQPCQDKDFRTGIELTLQSLQKSLVALGVTEIPAEGQPFDPQLHEAVEHIEDPQYGEGTVIRVIRTGFVRDGVVLRHTLVAVAN